MDMNHRTKFNVDVTNTSGLLKLLAQNCLNTAAALKICQLNYDQSKMN
jgi:hypothetical protein